MAAVSTRLESADLNDLTNAGNYYIINASNYPSNFSQYLGGATASLETKLAQKIGPSPMFDYEQNVEINPADELTEMQKNSLLYTMATRRMSNIITQMKTVINVGK